MTRGQRTLQAPGHLSCLNLGRAQNAGPTEPVPLRTTRVPEPEWLGPGRCMHPRVSLGLFPVEQPRARAVWAGRLHLPQRRVVWMWFGAFPGAFGLGRAQPQRRGATGESIPLLCLEGVPALPGAPQDEAGLTGKFAPPHTIHAPWARASAPVSSSLQP